METSDAAMERRDIAEGLRGLKGECVPIAYVLDELGVDCDGADVPKAHVERLAELIDRPTTRLSVDEDGRTCCAGCGCSCLYMGSATYCPDCGAEVVYDA